MIILKRTFLIFFQLFLVCISFGYQIDSLKREVNLGKEEQLTALLDLAWEYRYIDLDSAVFYINEGIDIGTQRSDTSAMVTGYLRKGIFLKDLGKWQEAEEKFQQALVLSKLKGAELDEGRVLINLGQLHKTKGDFEIATEEILAANKLFEKLNHVVFLKVSHNSLASLYLSMNRPKMAIESYQKLLDMAELVGDSSEISQAWYNLGIAYFQENDYQNSLYFLEKTLSVAEQYEDSMSLAQIYNAIGSVYFEQDVLDKSLYSYKKARVLAIETTFDTELAKILNNLAAVHESRKEWSIALTYYEEALSLATSFGNKSDVSQVLVNLSSVYELMGDSDRALNYYKQYSVLNDSIFNSNSHQRIIEMQEKYESAKKDKSIAQLNEERTLQRSAIEKRNLWLIGSGVIILLLLGLTIVYISRLSVQKSLAKKTEELYQQKTVQLVDENSVKTLGAYLDGETTERQRLAGELHDRLGSQLATVKIYYDRIEDQLKGLEQFKQVQKANTLLGEAYADVRKIAHDLSADALTQFGLEHTIAELCETLSSSGKLSVQLSSLGISNNRLSSTIELVVFRSIQELMTNIIKHSEASTVLVLLKEKEDVLMVRISDNGKGFDTSSVDKKTGFGLQNIPKRLAPIGGDFSIESEIGKGTKAVIKVPNISKS